MFNSRQTRPIIESPWHSLEISMQQQSNCVDSNIQRNSETALQTASQTALKAALKIMLVSSIAAIAAVHDTAAVKQKQVKDEDVAKIWKHNQNIEHLQEVHAKS